MIVKIYRNHKSLELFIELNDIGRKHICRLQSNLYVTE